MQSLEEMLDGTPYAAYTYSYPHKMAYRAFPEPLQLDELWAREDRHALFLYMHIPFCEMRCGFCNLFTTVDPATSFASRYLEALQRQTERARRALGECAIARMAIGGGTPTYLDTADLARLFDIAEQLFGIAPGMVPTSVETSPLTAQPEKLQLLRARGVDRVSIGVQSFIEEEAHAAGRSQKTADVEKALAAIREAQFPTLNIDLIYGLPGQTVESWLTSLHMALRYEPEELYLYPLYIRPLTGLDRVSAARHSSTEDLRLACYRAGRDLLLSAGYTQVSMRMFRAAHAPEETGPVYCVQEDGMVGLGCGARSYTSTHHYASEYAVGAKGVRAILSRYLETPAKEFDVASYGIALDGEEQRRRYIIKSLLEAGGLNCAAYQRRFGSDAFADLPALLELLRLELASSAGDTIVLTSAGIERSDTIGPWLYSMHVRDLVKGYALR
ncbi:MAG TPA: STM4012 family radical SAM protein [Ktedonosporobacter sp.]|nr:STM4012 family radical SAM protein [Ktedonosporobacter sp.]